MASWEEQSGSKSKGREDCEDPPSELTPPASSSSPDRGRGLGGRAEDDAIAGSTHPGCPQLPQLKQSSSSTPVPCRRRVERAGGEVGDRDPPPYGELPQQLLYLYLQPHVLGGETSHVGHEHRGDEGPHCLPWGRGRR